MLVSTTIMEDRYSAAQTSTCRSGASVTTCFATPWTGRVWNPRHLSINATNAPSTPHYSGCDDRSCSAVFFNCRYNSSGMFLMMKIGMWISAAFSLNQSGSLLETRRQGQATTEVTSPSWVLRFSTTGVKGDSTKRPSDGGNFYGSSIVLWDRSEAFGRSRTDCVLYLYAHRKPRRDSGVSTNANRRRANKNADRFRI